MLDMYRVCCRKMSKESAARLALTISMISWFLIGAIIGALFSLLFPVNRLNCVLTFGSACSLLVGCIYQMFAILRD